MGVMFNEILIWSAIAKTVQGRHLAPFSGNLVSKIDIVTTGLLFATLHVGTFLAKSAISPEFIKRQSLRNPHGIDKVSIPASGLRASAYDPITGFRILANAGLAIGQGTESVERIRSEAGVNGYDVGVELRQDLSP